MAIGFAALALSSVFGATPLWAREPVPARLHYRLADGPWQQCQMAVDADGFGWQLQIGPEQIRFRHDGRGAVAMERSGHPRQAVEARWLSDASLCWDGVCAKGSIPLD